MKSNWPPVNFHELVFEHLPLSLVDDSLQVSGVGTAQATILDVTANLVELDATPNQHVREIQDEMKNLQQQRQVITDRTATLGREQTLLGEIATGAATPAAPGANSAGIRPNPADWQQVMDFYNAGLEKIALEQRSLAREGADLDAKISSLNGELERLRGGGWKSVKIVFVHLSVESVGRLNLSLGFIVSEARW